MCQKGFQSASIPCCFAFRRLLAISTRQSIDLCGTQLHGLAFNWSNRVDFSLLFHWLAACDCSDCECHPLSIGTVPLNRFLLSCTAPLPFQRPFTEERHCRKKFKHTNTRHFHWWSRTISFRFESFRHISIILLSHAGDKYYCKASTPNRGKRKVGSNYFTSLWLAFYSDTLSCPSCRSLSHFLPTVRFTLILCRSPLFSDVE